MTDTVQSQPLSCPYTDVIFDYCDVLLDWRPRLPLDGQYPAGVVDMFFDKADEYGFDYYDAMSDSGWSEERVLDDYERHHGPAVAWVFRVYFERQRLSLYDMIDGMPMLLRDLDRAGVRLWGLTNFTAKYVHAAQEKFPWLRLLRDTVISSEERIRKPDPMIYRRAIERFGVDPAATAFVDDKAYNAAAATAVGLHGIQFRSAAQTRAALGL
ncbi:HAD-IA family hydrolase [Bifidobacterium amazonense]|uniref:HAD-IA family hydrolase n=1 Tax=Bifidobacterium amazonense TaxID=2809027 RepID=A0ABS9VY02_9BIFI|nr:HAD-IA family hydrolase [Bifidobacterium amazonense]MCH9276992.1 HAD-IA family hydrolase [Bifidobacterium amazonense]